MHVRLNKTSAGFSLIEVTLALLVIGLGLLAVFGLFGTGLQTNTQAQRETSIAFFAQQIMESAASTNWSDLATGVELSAFETDSGVKGYSSASTEEVVLDGSFYNYTLERAGTSGTIKHLTLGYVGVVDDETTTLKKVTLYFWNNPYLDPGTEGSFDPEPDATFIREFYDLD
jgi:prepilin-type N-terminal cleavage/methylation domain-containing protein